MITNKENSKKNISPINRLFNSIDNLLIEEREQRLKSKLGKEIKNCIFTDEIVARLNENDFSGVVDEQNNIVALFLVYFLCL